jgi:hypothetical protein
MNDNTITKNILIVAVLADHIGNTGLQILASSLSIYSTGVR